MKKLLILTVLLGFALPLMAQQIPTFSQYHLNPFLLNPARTGQTGNLQAFGIYRKQWADFEGAPETRLLSLDGALKNNKVGLGGYLYNDVTNIVDQFGGNFSYAYYINFSENSRLSIGLAAEMLQTRIDFSRAILDDPTEDVLSNNFRSGYGFDATAGINYQFKGLNIGVAVPRIIEMELKYSDNNNDPAFYKLSRHYLAHASYKIPVSPEVFSIEPSVLFRMAQGSVYQLEAGATFNFKDIIWAGGAYRHDYGATVGAGFRVHQRVGIGYAYDFAMNEIKDHSGGTHELLINVRFGKRDDKPILDAIKALETKQAEQGAQLDTIKIQNEEIRENNEELKKTIEEQNIKIEKLKEEIKQELEKVIIENRTGQGSVNPGDTTRSYGRGFDSQGRPIPAELVEEVGDWGNVEFLYGKSDQPYFMIVSSHRKAAEAKKHAQSLEKDGRKMGVVYNTERKWYYVFLEKPGDFNDGLKALYELRKDSDFKDAWIHVYR